MINNFIYNSSNINRTIRNNNYKIIAGVLINFCTSGLFSITGEYYVGRSSFLGGSGDAPPPKNF